MSVLSPFVLWAQNEKLIYLKIDLKDVKNPDIKLKKDRLDFKSMGVGAKGLNEYQFSLEFNKYINIKASNYKITDNRIDFTLSKTEKCWWPRLIAETQKPAWLKIDHDRFQSEETINSDNEDMVDIKRDYKRDSFQSEGTNDDNQRNAIDIRKDYPDLLEKLEKEEFGYKRENFKTVYLFCYNLFMFVGFMYIVIVLFIRYLRDGSDSFNGTYQAVGPAMCFMQLLQCLEVLHPLFGYVKGGLLMPFMQIGGRIFILFAMLEFEPKLQKMPVVFYLFLVWSFIEIIRYPYYISQIMRRSNGFLTWLRYSAWMVCYPVGFTCEAVIVFRNLIFVEQNNKWPITLPFIDYTIRFASILRVYMLFVMIPAIYTLMKHMYRARIAKIGPKKMKKLWKKMK